VAAHPNIAAASAAGTVKKAITDPDRRAKVIDALAEEDPDALKEFILDAMATADRHVKDRHPSPQAHAVDPREEHEPQALWLHGRRARSR
jgi:hypothetical protein